MRLFAFVRFLLVAVFALGTGVAFAAENAPAKPYKLIAHRGGVVEEKLPDNSFAALKAAAARGLPLGLDNKLFLSLEDADEFEKDSRLLGRTDRTGTGSYHLRPFGRPQIEGYFGGTLASDLEAGGPAAFFDFAVSELVGVLGSAFARRLKFIQMHCWGADPYSRGSYSYALPGQADMRAVLAAAVDERIFFAGEACSLHDFSTAHGGWFTGVDAADQVKAARQKRA